MVDALRKQWSKRHGAAVKQGIKRAKEHKRVVKQAALALRKAPKQEIVQRLFLKATRGRGKGDAAGRDWEAEGHAPERVQAEATSAATSEG